MVNTITIKKILNGYVVTAGWDNANSENTIHFPDMPTVVKHLDACFAEPMRNLTYVTKIKNIEPSKTST